MQKLESRKAFLSPVGWLGQLVHCIKYKVKSRKQKGIKALLSPVGWMGQLVHCRRDFLESPLMQTDGGESQMLLSISTSPSTSFFQRKTFGSLEMQIGQETNHFWGYILKFLSHTIFQRLKQFTLMLRQVSWVGRMGDFISRAPCLKRVLPQFRDLRPHYHYNNFLFPRSC